MLANGACSLSWELPGEIGRPRRLISPFVVVISLAMKEGLKPVVGRWMDCPHERRTRLLVFEGNWYLSERGTCQSPIGLDGLGPMACENAKVISRISIVAILDHQLSSGSNCKWVYCPFHGINLAGTSFRTVSGETRQ